MSGEERQGGQIETQPGPVPSDPEAFARNLARAVEEGGRALAAYLKPRERGEAPADEIAEHMMELMKTIGTVGAYWTADPNRLIEAQTRLWGNYLAIWNGALRRTAGDEAEEAVAPTPGDRRFADPDWSQNPMLSALKQLYLATSRWAEELVEAADGVDEHTKHKARFYIRQINDALAPTNFAVTNPEVIRETAVTNAENLVRGMHMLAEDLEAGHGTLRLRQSDTKGFKVGENLATTPGKVVFQDDICQIIQYAPMTETVFKRPLLIVPPWINKFYILDLTPSKSLIRWAVEQGHTVFVISWVDPDARHAEKSFEHYMKEGVLSALNVIERATGERKVNIMGYCIGGTLVAVTLAYMAEEGDDRIASATLMAAQIDFTHAGDLKVFVDEEQIASLERQMKAKGYLEGSKMATAFNLLRSNELIWPYVVNNYLLGREPFPFDLLYWNADSTRMPFANHSFYLRHFYLQNDLSQGRMVIGGRRLDLKKVTVPIYNLATREDHIAPAKSVFLGSSFFGGSVRFMLTGSGHIAGIINPPARKKYQHWIDGDPKGELEDWLARAKERPGSWWPDWQGWIEMLDDTRVPARKPGGGKLKALEDAPGSYVKMRA
jgi:polyhydroxyalkanoate synthase